ncbi:MAG: Fe-S cluster assembly protein SufD [Deltaproteobacteria bacterium]|nr:Fe-S cluster assembly protein SufD [Deltaproteobacteria bacterium]
MQALTEQHSPFAAAFGKWQSLRKAPAWVAELQLRAFDAYRTDGLPTRKHEAWKYVSLRTLNEVEFGVAPVLLDIRDVKAEISRLLRPEYHNLVFVNGHLAGDLSDPLHLDGLIFAPIADAFESEASLLRPWIERTLTRGDAFTQLNTAFLGNGLLIKIAADSTLTKTLHLIHVNTAEAHLSQTALRHLVHVAQGASLSLVETHVTLGTETKVFTNSLLEASVETNATLKLSRIDHQGAAALHIGRAHVELGARATLESFCFSSGGKLSRHDLDVSLCGEGAEATLNGLYLTKAGQVIDNHTTMRHLVPNAVSRQLYKGILDGDSRAVFNGKVVVSRDAQSTSAQQLNRNLLLSDDAEIDTKPELLIDADDVKCAHGASIGQLTDDQIFYLRSRGLGLEEARRLLTMGFADEVLYKAPVIREWLRPLIAEEYFV